MISRYIPHISISGDILYKIILHTLNTNKTITNDIDMALVILLTVFGENFISNKYFTACSPSRPFIGSKLNIQSAIDDIKTLNTYSFFKKG